MAGGRKIAWILLLALLVIAGLVARIYPELLMLAQEWQTRHMFVPIDEDGFDPGPQIGSHFPGVHALYQGRPINLLQPLAGTRGLVLVVLGSPAESPFCRRQLQQLQDLQPRYRQAGLGLVAISHITATQAEVLTRQDNINIPLLLDQETLSFRTLGLLDTRFPTDSPAYGRAYPGFIVINPEGLVVAKFFLADRHKRIDGTSALQSALHALENH